MPREVGESVCRGEEGGGGLGHPPPHRACCTARVPRVVCVAGSDCGLPSGQERAAPLHFRRAKGQGVFGKQAPGAADGQGCGAVPVGHHVHRRLGGQPPRGLRRVDEGKPPHRTAPHRTAPHRTAPHRTAPHRTAPHRTAPRIAERWLLATATAPDASLRRVCLELGARLGLIATTCRALETCL